MWFCAISVSVGRKNSAFLKLPESCIPSSQCPQDWHREALWKDKPCVGTKERVFGDSQTITRKFVHSSGTPTPRLLCQWRKPANHDAIDKQRQRDKWFLFSSIFPEQINEWWQLILNAIHMSQTTSSTGICYISGISFIFAEQRNSELIWPNLHCDLPDNRPTRTKIRSDIIKQEENN